jgi:hypothetical protein
MRVGNIMYAYMSSQSIKAINKSHQYISSQSIKAIVLNAKNGECLIL